MAKRGNSGDRVLESKHVIGLFLLMLLFSGVFFSLGYVMGRNQLEAQVRAASNLHASPSDGVPPEVAPRHTTKKNTPDTSSGSPNNSDSTPASSNGWGFYENTKSTKGAEPLHPVSQVSAPKPLNVKQPTAAKTKAPMSAPIIVKGSYVLQVAALTKENDALALANTLQKKGFPAMVLSPQANKFYRVQVGPYADPKAADIAKKGLEDTGFKAIVKH